MRSQESRLCDGSTSEDSMSALSVRRPDLSKRSGGGPADEDHIIHMDRYWSRNVSVGQGRNDRITLYAIECRDKTEIKHSSEETVIDYSQSMELVLVDMV